MYHNKMSLVNQSINRYEGKRMPKKRRTKAERRSALLAAARRRFKQTGLAETTLEMVAKDAGLPRPHLYRFFKNKAELISAVIASEVVEINTRRWAQVRRLRSFERQIVRSLELAVELIRNDKFWASLIAPGNVPYTAYAASADPAILQSNLDYWTPILDRAQSRGELRQSLARQDILSWLLGVQFMFMERSEIFPSVDEVGRYARLFVVPALLANAKSK